MKTFSSMNLWSFVVLYIRLNSCMLCLLCNTRNPQFLLREEHPFVLSQDYAAAMRHQSQDSSDSDAKYSHSEHLERDLHLLPALQ